MTGSPQRVRAIARHDTEAPAHSGPAILLPRRRPGYLGPVHITQLLLAEAAIVAVLAVLTRGVVVAGVVAGACVILLSAALGRHRGRWWLERRLMTRQYRRRRRSRPATDAEDPRLIALRWLAPDLTVEDVPAADGSRIGVARDDAGWYAVATITATAPMRDDPRRSLPLNTLVGALADANQPGAVLQVVTHTVPAPSLDAHPASPMGQSYRQLLGSFGSVPVPADRATWIAVRLDARSLAEAGAYGADLDIAPAVVAALVRRVVKSLRHTGVAYQVLDANGLVGALTRSCDLDPTAQNGTAEKPHEDWSEWHSPRLAHRSFWVRGWPPLSEASALLDWLTTAPAATTSVALILVPEDETVDLRCLVRVAAPAAALSQICETITRRAHEARADLFQLDGEQGPAVYASAPTGGGPR